MEPDVQFTQITPISPIHQINHKPVIKENNNPITPDNQNSKEQENAPDLIDRGHKDAGRSFGAPEALENGLYGIKSEHFMDENNNEEKKEREKEKVLNQIVEIQGEIVKLEGENEKITESKIPAIQLSIKGIQEEISVIKLETEKKKKGEGHTSKFDLGLYWLIFIPATFFLIAFYASAFHAGFYRDVLGEARKAGADNINSVFNLVFNVQAFREVNLHWLAPIIFFVFGIILHISFETKGWTKPVKLIVTLIFIAMADGLLAFFIENKTHQLKVMMGLVEKDYQFYYSPVFFMVLVLGYFTCLGWSIILHQIRNEYKKFDYEGNSILTIKIKKEKILILEHEIKSLNGDVIEKKALIAQLTQKVDALKIKANYVIVSLSLIHI